MTRDETIRLLVGFERPSRQLRAQLASFEWDWKGPPIAWLDGQHVASVLLRYTKGEISEDEVEAWANLLEGRDDVELSPAAASAIFDLANPDLQGPLVDIASALIDRL